MGKLFRLGGVAWPRACRVMVVALAACTVEVGPDDGVDEVGLDDEDEDAVDAASEFRGATGPGAGPPTEVEGYDEVVCAKFVSVARATVGNMMNSCAECGGDGAIGSGTCCEMSDEATRILMFLLNTPCARHPNILEQILEVAKQLEKCNGLCDGCGWGDMASSCNSCFGDGYTACEEHDDFACCGYI